MSSPAALRCRRPHRLAFTLVELLVVIGLVALLMSVLLPSLSAARKRAMRAKLEAEERQSKIASLAAAASPAPESALAVTRPTRPLAHVKSFDADIRLTPRLSVGTEEPESIYEAKFAGTLNATAAAGTDDRGGGGEHEIELPLPPQIISLADLRVTVDGRPDDTAELRDDRLVWHGKLPPAGGAAAPARLSLTYTAVGKGLFTLRTPPGKVVDRYRVGVVASGSDVRMLDLSLQPTHLVQSAGGTTYTWDYARLMFGRPIALDVLGIAPVDRLGELRWLGPLSVVVFGALLGLVTRAWGVDRFDRWMLLLVLGMFAGAYPMMYFAQEFIPLRTAMAVSAGAVLLIIALRTSTAMGFRRAVAGVVLPAAVVMSLTLTAAIRPQLQGILLTGLALAVFGVGMLVAPRLHVPSAPASAEPAIG